MQEFFDPYGNCIKLAWNPQKDKIKYSSGIITNHLEFDKLSKSSMWNPDIHPSRIFMSKITSYTLVHSNAAFLTLDDFVQFSLASNFDYCIITKYSKKKFQGTVVNNFLQKGTISSGIDNIEFSAGQDDSYFGVIRSKNKNSRYEGGIFEEKKEGYGKYFENDKKVFEGYFADNLPYGKGILYGGDGGILFKGIFREGLKMHGVSCIDGKTVSGIIHHHMQTVHDPSWFIT